MSRRVAIGVRMFTTRLFSMTVLAVVPSMAEAQNTVVLDCAEERGRGHDGAWRR